MIIVHRTHESHSSHPGFSLAARPEEPRTRHSRRDTTGTRKGALYTARASRWSLEMSLAVWLQRAEILLAAVSALFWFLSARASAAADDMDRRQRFAGIPEQSESL